MSANDIATVTVEVMVLAATIILCIPRKPKKRRCEDEPEIKHDSYCPHNYVTMIHEEYAGNTSTIHGACKNCGARFDIHHCTSEEEYILKKLKTDMVRRAIR